MSEPVTPSLRVHHLAVKVHDLARAEAFYAGALGLPVMRRQVDEHGAPRSIWLALADGAFLAVERAAEHAQRPEPAALEALDGEPGWHCVALGIAATDREAWRARLDRRGHTVVRETAYTLYVRDPEGAIVALSHYPHAIAELVGSGERGPDADGGDPGTRALEAGPDLALESRAPTGVTSRLAALVTLSIAMLALLTPGDTVSAQRRTREPPDVVVLGSSSIHGALGRLIEEQLVGAGLRVRRVGHRSTGFARPDFFDWQSQIPQLGDLASMRGVVVYMGGNDTNALRLTREESPDRGDASWIPWHDEARWRPVYVARVHRFVEGLCDAGARRAVLLLPADGDREGWSDRIQRVQDAQAEGARGTRCGVVVDPRGGDVRRGDTIDGVHLSTRGARDLLMRIGPPIVAAIAG